MLPPGAGVTCIKWVSGSETVFWAGYDDGSVVVWDRDRNDPGSEFYPKEDIAARMAGLWKEQQPSSGTISVHQVTRSVFWTYKAGRNGGPAQFVAPTDSPIARPPSAGSNANPVAYHKVSKKAITALAFSPDCQHVGIASADGLLKLVDYHSERLTDTFSGYFGGITCLAWSPDGKFLLLGGQDDLISVLSLPLRRVVARAEGHSSWVTALQFDQWRCTDKVYRFGSVGEDGRLCLWDFGPHSLHRPRGTMRRARGNEQDGSKGEVIHPLLPRGEVAIIYPVAVSWAGTKILLWSND